MYCVGIMMSASPFAGTGNNFINKKKCSFRPVKVLKAHQYRREGCAPRHMTAGSVVNWVVDWTCLSAIFQSLQAAFQKIPQNANMKVRTFFDIWCEMVPKTPCHTRFMSSFPTGFSDRLLRCLTFCSSTVYCSPFLCPEEF